MSRICSEGGASRGHHHEGTEHFLFRVPAQIPVNPAHSSGAGRAEASSLLGQEGHRSALVQQAQLAVLVLPVTGVAVDAAVQEGPVEVTDQRADVACTVRLARPLVGVLQALDVFLDVGIPHVRVALIEAVDLADLGDLDIPVGREIRSLNGMLPGTRHDMKFLCSSRHEGLSAHLDMKDSLLIIYPCLCVPDGPKAYLWVSTNSPIMGSSVKPYTPVPTLSTRTVELL